MAREENNKSVEELFKDVAIEYITKKDKYDIASIFESYDSYTINELFTINEFNEGLIAGAKRNILNYARESAPNIYDLEVYIYDDIIDTRAKQSRKTKLRLYYLLLIAFVNAFYQAVGVFREIEYDKFKPEELDSEGYYAYRGQSNAEWRISPSMLRGLNKDIAVDDNYYFYLLKEDEKEERYNDLIKHRGTLDNKYYKYAFMQHAASFSPLIDLTGEFLIATSFALSNVSNANEFREHNSVVFQINIPNSSKTIIKNPREARNFLKNEFEMKVISSSHFKLGKEYMLIKKVDVGDSKVTIKYDSIIDFINALIPKYKVINIKTNDRMKYQDGSFICFYGCLCLKTYICYELCEGLKITKIIIPKNKKRKILNDIYKNHREFDLEHLMDPYKYFNE